MGHGCWDRLVRIRPEYSIHARPQFPRAKLYFWSFTVQLIFIKIFSCSCSFDKCYIDFSVVSK